MCGGDILKKKILIITRDLSMGGVEKSLINLLNSINYDKYAVDLMLYEKKGLFINNLPLEVNVINFPKYYDWVLMPKKKILYSLFKSIGFNLNVFKFIYYLLWGLINKNMGIARQKLWKSVEKKLPNITIEYIAAIDYSGQHKHLILDKVDADKKITWIHSEYHKYGRNKSIDNEDYSRIDSIVVVSETVKKCFIEAFPHHYNKVELMYNVIDKENIIRLASEKILFDESFDGIRILDATRLDASKGLDIAIETCNILIKEKYNVKWYILGEGKERKKVKKIIKKYNMEKHFILLGNKQNPYPYIKKADIIVHCSLFEGKSVFLDESKLLAKPIVVTKYKSVKDQISDGETGLISDFSSNKVAEKIKLLIDDNILNYYLRKKLENFDISVIKSMNIFYNLIEK